MTGNKNAPTNNEGAKELVENGQGKDTKNNFQSLIRGKIDENITTVNQPISSGEVVTPMPIDLLPYPVQEIISELSTTLNYCPEYTAASMLFAASVAIGNSYRVQVKNGWTESTVIFVALVGESGIGKTTPLNTIIAPIKERDGLAFADYKRAKEAHRINSNKKKNEQDPNLQEPVLCKTILTDCTPEALAKRHEGNERGIAYCIDELAGWFKNFNRYNKGSEQEMWLSLWSTQPINIDRKGGEPIHIAKTFVSVAGGIQPSIIHRMASDDRDGNGFVYRILFVTKDNLQKQNWTDQELDENILIQWKSILNYLFALQMDQDEYGSSFPNVIPFTIGAREIIKEWQARNTDRCNNDDGYKAVGAKIETYAVRLSLIIQGLFSACNNSLMTAVTDEATTAGIAFADYFADQAMKVKGSISGEDPLSLYNTINQKFYNALPQKFATREALEIAERIKFPERSAKRFLTDKKLFSKYSHGNYQKLV